MKTGDTHREDRYYASAAGNAHRPRIDAALETPRTQPPSGGFSFVARGLSPVTLGRYQPRSLRCFLS